MPRLRVFAALMGIVCVTNAVAQLQPGSAWPKFQGNLANTGLATGGGCNGVLKWSVPCQVAAWSSPVIAADGTLYVSTTQGLLQAVNSVDGSFKWSFPTGSNIVQTPYVAANWASPAIGSDGTVYVEGGGSIDKTALLYAVNPDGTQKWSYAGYADGGFYQPTGAPTVMSDGTILFSAQEFTNNVGSGTNQNYLFALNPNGTLKWAFGAGQDFVIACCPAIGPDGSIYIGTWDGIDNLTTGRTYSVNPGTGAMNWKFDTPGQLLSSPVVAPNGMIYVGEQGISYNLHFVTSKGVESGSFVMAGGMLNSPACDSSGNLYIPVAASYLFSLNPSNGTSAQLGIGVAPTCPALGLDGTIYAGLDDYGVGAYSPNGAAIWKLVLDAAGGGAGVNTDIAVGSNGTIYFGAIYGNLYAVGTQSNVVELLGLTVNPSTVPGGVSSTGTVTLSEIAPIGGTVVSLASGTTSVATTPMSVTVPSGKSSATFTITTKTVTAQKVVQISATLKGKSKEAPLTVVPPVIVDLNLDPPTVQGGSSSSGNVTLSGPAPSGGIVIKIASDNKAAIAPGPITIAAGKTMGSFVVKTIPVSVKTVANLKATSGSTSVAAPLTILSPALKTLTVSPSTIKGGAHATGTVTLTSPAPTGGTVITLASNQSAAKTPATVTVPAGKTSVTFQVVTKAVAAQTAAAITATLGATTDTAKLTITK